MSEQARKKQRAYISEDDIATVLQRYPATTVLALLKEVARFPDAKLDWKELVKNTETGISSAREYQMLWRHLAYRQTLLDEPEDRAGPLDDDSDLEYELATFPLVSLEASAEAAACVKVMMESGSSDAGNPGCTMVEAPLMINIPNGHLSNVPSENSKTPCSMQGINITVPICVQKQPIPSLTSTEGLDACGTLGGNMAPRRKRKPWTEAEDAELVAAVKKYGEGSWPNISRRDFKGDRTAYQLSQRWANIRKKNGNINVGRVNPLSGPQLSEAQLAARNAMNLALNPRVKNITSSSSIVRVTGTGVIATPGNPVRPKAEISSMQAGNQSQQAGTGLKAVSSSSVRPPNIEAGSSLQASHPSQQCPTPSKSSPMRTLGLSPKSRLIAKIPSAKSIYNSDSMVIATAVAAGARIATQSIADSVIKAAKNVHIMPTGGATTHLPGHPNVHYIRTGRAATPHVLHPSGTTSSTCRGPTRISPSTIQWSSSISSTLPNSSSKQTNGSIPSSLASESPLRDVKTAKENRVSQMDNAPKEKLQDDGASVADSSSNSVPKEQVQKDSACVADAPSKHVPEEQVQQDGGCAVDTPSNQVEEDATPLSKQAGLNEGTIAEDHLKLKTTMSESVFVVGTLNNQIEEGKTVSSKQAGLKEETITEDPLNLKTRVSNEACVVDAPSNQVEEDKTASLKQAGLKDETVAEDLLNLKTTVCDEAAAVAKKAEESQVSSQNNSKIEVSQVANQDKDKVKECQDANQNKNNAEESPNANQNSNNTDEGQDTNVMGDSEISTEGGRESVIENRKNEKMKSLFPIVAADEAS